jgi:L-fuculose-phosphate aldolase
MFYEDCAYLPEYPGVPIGDEEGRLIAEALGDKRSILLAHHGQLAACKTIEEATMLGIFIERAAKLQLMARAAGTIKAVRPECIREAHDYRLKPKYVEAVFCYYARRALRRSDEVLT